MLFFSSGHSTRSELRFLVAEAFQLLWRWAVDEKILDERSGHMIWEPKAGVFPHVPVPRVHNPPSVVVPRILVGI